MAGFDFEFTSKPDEEDLQRQFLRWIQGASRDLGLKFSYRKHPRGFYAAIDGALPEMQALPLYCYSELDAIVAVSSNPPDVSAAGGSCAESSTPLRRASTA